MQDSGRFPGVFPALSRRLVDRLGVSTEGRMGHMSKDRRGYVSYLIRLWQIKNAGKLVWRASLESPSTGERVGFASLDELFGFLRRQTRPVPDADANQDTD